jgi:hypothetical protein
MPPAFCPNRDPADSGDWMNCLPNEDAASLYQSGNDASGGGIGLARPE